MFGNEYMARFIINAFEILPKIVNVIKTLIIFILCL
jgi:hypothetical protein